MVTIEAAGPDDLVATSALHRQHLDAGLFPRLGARFMRRYHESFLASPHAVALVAHSDGRSVGFLLGTTDNRAHYRWVVNERGFTLARSGALALLCRPQLAWVFATTRLARYARGLRRHLGAATSPSGVQQAAVRPQLAVLTHVAIAEGVRRQGVGRGLVEAFVAEATARGAAEAHLITAVPGPGSDFYLGLGWQAVSDRRAQDGSTVREFRLLLSEVQAE